MAYPQMYGATTIEYALKSDDGWCIDLDDIDSKMDSDVRLLVLINPNNPTGNVAGKNEIQKLLAIAKKWPDSLSSIIIERLRMECLIFKYSIKSSNSDLSSL